MSIISNISNSWPPRKCFFFSCLFFKIYIVNLKKKNLKLLGNNIITRFFDPWSKMLMSRWTTKKMPLFSESKGRQSRYKIPNVPWHKRWALCKHVTSQSHVIYIRSGSRVGVKRCTRTLCVAHVGSNETARNENNYTGFFVVVVCWLTVWRGNCMLK